MELHKLIDQIRSLSHVRLWKSPSPDLKKTITSITFDSKTIKKNGVFIAVQGATSNGEDFIPEAVQKKVRVIVCSTDGINRYADQFPNVVFVESPQPRKTGAFITSLLYPERPTTLVAVTGTNGKTSTVDFCRQLWDLLGYKSASLGTLGIRSRYMRAKKHLTTPDPVTFHKRLTLLARKGITHLALEASSHGLAHYRLDGVVFQAAGITNISRDHLDFHQTMEAYIQAKARLLSDLLSRKGTGVLNQDIPEYAIFQKALGTHPVITYGKYGDTIQVLSIIPFQKSQQVTVRIQHREFTFQLPLMGSFQVENVLCALGLVMAATPHPIDELIPLLERLKGPPGRLEWAGNHSSGAPVFVDFAHSSGGIASILSSLRPHISGAIWIVFGAGGGRDPGTRLLMGQAAAQGADHVIITDDNPRFEDPAHIRAQIKAGCPKAFNIPDRQQAIQFGVENLTSLDCLVIAGKGPENGQIVQGVTHPFLDKKVAQEILKNLKKDQSRTQRPR